MDKLEKPLTLNEDDKVRAYFLGRSLHFYKRALWRMTPLEIAAKWGLDVEEVAKAAGRR